MESVKTMKLMTPKPNQFYYKSYFFLGMLMHPRRLYNFVKYSIGKFNNKVNYLPTMMDLEPSQRCNFHCLMCTPFKEKRADMTFDEFKKIIDDQIGLLEIKIQGVGEPLLCGNFIRMIKYARSKMLWVRTTTNGSLLHLNDNYKKLVDSGVHDINISIDGSTKEVYETIRAGGNFEQLCENCRLINDYNNRIKKTVVRAWVVMQKQNKNQFLEFPKFFSKLGFKEMTISFAMHNYGRQGRNKEADTFNWSAKDNPIDSGSKECYKGSIIGYPVAYGGYNEYFEKTTGNARIILNETIKEVNLNKRSLKLSDGTILTGDIIVSSLPIDELCGFSLGELPFAGREFQIFVLPCRQVFPADIRFCHYTQHETYTRIVEYKKLTYYDSPDTLLGMEMPSKKNKLYPYMIKRHLATAKKYVGTLPENVFSIGRAGTYKYSTIEQTIVQSFAVLEKIMGKSPEAMGGEFYDIGDLALIRERKRKV